MKTWFKAAAVGMSAALAMAGTVAFAGSTRTHPLEVIDGSYAYGSYSQTRDSTDTGEYIYCYSVANSAGGNWAVCTAYDSDNDYVSCTMPVDEQVELIAGIGGDDSAIYFSNSGGNCSNLYVYHDTRLIP